MKKRLKKRKIFNHILFCMITASIPVIVSAAGSDTAADVVQGIRNGITKQEEDRKAADLVSQIRSDLWLEAELRKSIVDDMIFVGDSRITGMSNLGDYHYVSEVASGLSWLGSTGCHLLYDVMSQYPEAAVVFCLGVNDFGNIGGYIDWYNGFLQSYPERRTFFMSVCPINDAIAASCGYKATDAMVSDFNNSLRAAFPDRYIDTYTYLLQNGYSSPDGVHYEFGTYAAIEEYTIKEINMR